MHIVFGVDSEQEIVPNGLRPHKEIIGPHKGIIGPHKGIIEPEYLDVKGPWAQGPWAI